MLRVLLTGLIAASAWNGATAADIDHARQYEACMALAEREPDDAFSSALTWRDVGGGDAADHCIAKALFFLKQYSEAARRFEELAQKVVAEPEFKAALLGHAAQGWLLDGNPEHADDVLSAAIELRPGNTDLLIDRGLARADMHRYKAAVEDFSRAIALDNRLSEAFAFRASAYRYLDDLNAARADIERALTIDPDNMQALLERGIIRRLMGDDAGAREDWILVLRLAPATPTAKSAQANLQILDSGVPSE